MNHKTYLEHFSEPLEVRELHLQIPLNLLGEVKRIGRHPLPFFQMVAPALVPHDLPRRVAIGRSDFRVAPTYG